MTSRSIIGDTPRRREDARFITGQGALSRRPALRRSGARRGAALAARARADRAASMQRRRERCPGVLAVLTGADANADGLQPMRPTVEANVQTGETFAFAPQPLLAPDKVRHVGEPVALIVAETRALALDAAERVVVEYQPLPAVTTAADARAPERRSFPPRCRAMSAWTGAGAMRTRSTQRSPPRHTWSRCASTTIASSPIRWSRAARSAASMRRPVATRCSSPARTSTATATPPPRALGVPPAAVRFVAPDVGGGFGAKNFTYAEHALILWAAKRVGRPVKWIATRSEVFVSDHQARDHQADAALALDADGRFLALRVVSMANIGAYMAGGAGAVQTNQYVHLQGTHLRDSGDRAARRRGAEQHHADRRHARSRLCRGGQHHRTADRCGRAAMRLRSRRAAPPQHGARRRDADDQCASASRWTAAISRRPSIARWRRPMSPASPRGAPTARRAACCAASASPITSRPPAVRRTRTSISVSSPTARCR